MSEAQDLGSVARDPVEGSKREALLRDVLVALTSGDDLHDTLQRCAQAVVERFDGAFARIWTLDQNSQTLHLQASAGMYTHLDGAHSSVPVGELKIGRIAAQRKPHLTNDVLHDSQISDPQWAREHGMVSFAGYPLLVGDDVVGVVALFAREPLSRSTLEAFADVADSLALGIRRRDTETQLRDENRVLDLLYQLGTDISRERELKGVVQIATDAATELSGAQFGAFFYNAIGEEGESYTLYTLSGVPYEAFADFDLPRNTAIFGPTFRGEGVVRLDDVLSDERYGHEAPHHGMPPGHLPVRSYLAVPVIAEDGDVIGGLFFGHATPGVFSEREERIVTGIAGLAAGAVQKARLYEREHEAAITFQRRLLPERLPAVEGVTLAASYLPASQRAEVGGDWYDAVVRADGVIAVSVGDVVGHDLRAAASMGQLRAVARAYLMDAASLTELIVRLDRLVADAGLGDVATTIQAWYDPRTGTLDLLSAGHPPALVIAPDRTAEFLPLQPTAPVGFGLIDEDVASGRELRTVLEPGSTLVLYSDGLIERRGQTIDAGLERLRRAAEAGAMLTGEALCAFLLAELVSVPSDDIALVVLQTPSVSPVQPSA